MPSTPEKASGPAGSNIDVLLVTVTKVEATAVFAELGITATQSRCIINDKTYYDFGEIGGSRIVMVRSERGSGGVDGSFPTIDEAIRTLDPGAVIMVGIAFGVDPSKQKIGDILVARQLQGYDLKRVGTDSKGRAEIVLRGDRPSCSQRLLDRFRDGELDWQGTGVKFGLMLSGNSLVDHIDYRDQLKKLVPEAVGGEMEGVGLYAAAHRHKVDWILVKAICDFADGNKKKDKKKRQQLAAANAVGFVTHVLKLGGLAKDRHKSSAHGDETGRPGKAAVLAEKRYLEELRKQCNYLPLGAMGGEQDFSDGISLDQVYVELYTRTMVLLTDDEKKQHQKRERSNFYHPEKNERPLKAREAAARTRQLVLLGDPGSGKSTFVRQLAADLAAVRLQEKKEALVGWEDKPLPLLLDFQKLVAPLKDLSLEGLSERNQCESMAEVVYTLWQALFAGLDAQDLAGMLNRFLDDGQVLMIFDGLDEVPEGMRTRMRQAVQAVRRIYSKKNRVIVTCRIRSYQGDVSKLSGFAEHALASFSEEQIGDFTMAWYKAQAGLGRLAGTIDPVERAEDLKKAALSKDLLELSENPLLLTTMAIIHQKETELPRQRVSLYDKAVEVLLSRWQKEKPGVVVSEELSALLKDYRLLRTLMEQLAYLVHQQQAQAGAEKMLNRGELIIFLEQPQFLGRAGLAADFLDFIDLRAGLLIGHGGEGDRYPKTYSFPHRTFQEYLVGCRMVRGRERDIKQEYRQRAGEGDFWTLAALLGAEELYYFKWDDKPLLDLAYSLCPGTEPQDEGAWRAHLWSGQMALLAGFDAIRRDTEEPDGGIAYLERLIPRLCSLISGNSLGPIERAEAGRVLAKLGDPRKGVGLDRGGLPDIYWVKIEKGSFTMGSDKKKDPKAWDDEEPQGEYTIPYDYRISRYPVTNVQFRAFVDAKGYRIKKYWSVAMDAGFWNKEGFKGKFDKSRRSAPYEYGEPYNLANHPAVVVTWYEALAFCAWLTERLRQVGKLDKGRIITLPDEPEWEKAARGEDGRIYPWGNDPGPNRANYDKTGINSTSAVGCFPKGASPYGVEEMSGNVWEWTRSLRGDYPYPKDKQALRKREDLRDDKKVLRVGRGGSFRSDDQGVRCAFRLGDGPFNRYWSVGFRVVSPPILKTLNSEL